MTFSASQKDRAIEIIKAAERAPRPLHILQAIANGLPLVDEHQAKQLVVALAEEHRITVDWRTSPITVTVGRKPSAFSPAKPLVSVAKPSARKRPSTPVDEEATFRRIREILDRGKKAVAPDPKPMFKPVPLAKPEPVKPAPATPQKAVPIVPDTAPIGSNGPRQINIRVSAEQYRELERRAGSAMPVGRAALTILASALDGSAPANADGPKLRIPASVTALSVRDGIPVMDLVAMLIARGVRSYEADAAAELAA